MKKRVLTLIITIFGLAIFLNHTTFAGVSYKLDDFIKNNSASSIKFIKIGGVDYLKAGLSPDFSLGPVDLGLDINLYSALGATNTQPEELQSLLILRKIAYDHEQKFGFTWGRLSNITLGYGLLMDNYDSGSGGSTTEFTSRKAGFWGYGTLCDTRMDVLWTATHVKGVRLAHQFNDINILNVPLILGGTYVTDSDGLDEAINGMSLKRDAMTGMSIDCGLPIAGDFLTGYTEYTRLLDQASNLRGQGAAVGIKGLLFDQADYKIEYRRLGAGFVPGYFNSIYEGTSFNFDSPARAMNGYMAGANANFFSGYFRGGLMLEGYEDRAPLMTAAFGWKEFQRTVGVINYTVPFNGEGNKVINLDLLYLTGSWCDIEAHMRRTYKDPNTFTEYWTIGSRINLGQLFPNLPGMVK